VGLANGATYTYNFDVNVNSKEYEPYQGEFSRLAQEQLEQYNNRKPKPPRIGFANSLNTFADKENNAGAAI
jgi:hypothetical protein